MFSLDDSSVQALGDYVVGGGHLAVWYFSGIADENQHVTPGGYPGRLRELLGIRVTAAGGDGSYSVGEFAVFGQVPQGWPGIALTRAEGAAPDGGSSGWGVSLGVLAAAIAILIFLSRKRRPPAGEPIAPEAPPSP
jgi:hypothetical protein